MQAAYFRVGGRTFDRQDPLGRLTFQGAQHLQTLGALTDYDRYKEDAEKNWPWERWQGDYGWRKAHLLRREETRYRWFLDQLVVVRDEERTRLGYVTRVAFTPPDRARDVAHALAGAAAIDSPCARRRSRSPRSCRCRRSCSSAVEDRPVSLIVPPRTFTPGRLLRSMDTGPERKFRLTKLLQRGGDFERVRSKSRSSAAG